MNRRDRLAWGLVGALAFLVSVQAFELAARVRVGFGAKFAVALAVGLVTVGLAPAVERRFAANESA